MKPLLDKRRPFSRSFPKALRIAAGLGVFLVVSVLYLRTLAPTVLYYEPNLFPDSAMLQVQAALLDIPNPTGYPTYIMLVHLFTYLPFGDPAYRVNLASAVFGALTVLFIYLLCLALTRSVAASAAGALAFGVSVTFWSQAVIAEVYTLNTLFIAAILLVLLLWRERRRDGYLLLAAFLMGLSLSHHLTSGLLLPAAALFVGLVDRSRLARAGLVLRGAGLFLVGLLPYLYLPLRASMDPPLNVGDPTTLERFRVLVTGARFEGRMFAYGPELLPGRVAYYLALLSEQFHPALLAAAVAGILYLLLRDRAALALLSFLFAGWLVYALEYNIKDVYLYFIPTYLILAVFTAAGFRAVLETVGALGWLSPVLRGAVVPAVSILMVVLSVATAGEAYARVDRSGDYHGREIIESVAENAGRGATVLHRGSILWYMTLFEERRKDLTLVDPFKPGEWRAGTERWVVLSEEYLKDGPVYILFPGDTAKFNAERFESAGYRLVPMPGGIFYEVVEK